MKFTAVWDPSPAKVVEDLQRWGRYLDDFSELWERAIDSGLRCVRFIAEFGEVLHVLHELQAPDPEQRAANLALRRRLRAGRLGGSC